MTIKAVPAKPDPDHVDPLTEKIRDSIRGVEHLRSENSRLTDQLKSLETANLQLESQVESLKLTLEQERAERRHYHSLANEIITRLDVVGQTIDDVVRRAEQETYRQRKEKPRAEGPEADMPAFLKKVEALTNGKAEKPNGFAQ
jgi:predicted RNase H-like nuclease (RuvC/YqgF family)